MPSSERTSIVVESSVPLRNERPATVIVFDRSCRESGSARRPTEQTAGAGRRRTRAVRRLAPTPAPGAPRGGRRTVPSTAPVGPGRRCEARATTRAGSSGTWTRREVAPERWGTAVAGTIAAPWPSTARVARRRTPSTSASALEMGADRQGGTIENPAGGRIRAVGGAGDDRPARRGGSMIGGRAGGPARQEAGGPRRTAARCSARARRWEGGRWRRRTVPTAGQGSTPRCCPRRRSHGRADAPADMSARRRGSSHRGVVPSIPRRTSPTMSPSRWAISAAISSSSRRIRRARSTTLTPSSVRSAVGPVDQLRAELFLQSGNVAGHVGLDREQGSSSCRERPVVGDRHEGGELADVHRRHHSAPSPGSDGRHRYVRLARSAACAYTHKHIVEAIHPPCTARSDRTSIPHRQGSG